jgi:MFS family permease
MQTPSPSLSSSLRALPRAAWILFLGTFLNKFGGFVVPFLALYLTGRGYSITAAGMAIFAYGAGNLLSSLIGGHLADHLGRRQTIALSMFLGAASMMLLSQARGLPSIIALAALAGLTGEMYRPASSALLTDLVPAGRRVTAFSTYRLAINAGWAFGPATAGVLAGHGYFWLFAGDAATSVLFGFVALLALPKTAHPPPGKDGWEEVRVAALRDRALQCMLVSGFAIGFVFFQTSSTFGLHLTHLGYSPRVYGALVSLNGVLIVLCELPLTTITRRFAATRVMATGFLVAGSGLALIAFGRSLPYLACCIALFTLGEMIAMPVAGAFVADLAPPSIRGRYMGVYGLTWTVALMVGPALGMQLLAMGAPVLWLACGGLGVVAAVFALKAGKGSGC